MFQIYLETSFNEICFFKTNVDIDLPLGFVSTLLKKFFFLRKDATEMYFRSLQMYGN